MGDKTRGIYEKFIVHRTDGEHESCRKHDGCEYFVLDLSCDDHARPAIMAYARSCKADYPLLAADLLKKAHEIKSNDDDRQECEAEAMGYTHTRSPCDDDCPVCFPTTADQKETP